MADHHRGRRTEAGTKVLPGSGADVSLADRAGTSEWDQSSGADRWLLPPGSERLLLLALSGYALVRDADAAGSSGMRSAGASRR